MGTAVAFASNLKRFVDYFYDKESVYVSNSVLHTDAEESIHF